MNLEYYQELSKFTKKTLKEFFIVYIGLDCFIKEIKIKRLTKQTFKSEIKYFELPNEICDAPFAYRLKLTYKNDKHSYLLYNNTKERIYLLEKGKELQIFSLQNYEVAIEHEVISFLIKYFDNSVIVSTFEAIRALKSLFYLKKQNKYGYRFVIGAGVNKAYKMDSWDGLQKKCNDALDTLTYGHAKEINDLVFNTNYGPFQILKDLSILDYRTMLVNLVNGYEKPFDFKRKTSLNAVASILIAQKELAVNGQNVLTFNYDGLLEKSIKKSSGCTTFFRKSGLIPISKKYEINVIHNHGFLDESHPSDKQFKSIVLTTEEYFSNYKGKTSYGYSNLYRHLDDICTFIGNSISDYEEQKVLYKHFYSNPSSFHFSLESLDLSKGRSLQAILYKTIFLLKIGVIPLWYDEHEDYIEALFREADDLKNIFSISALDLGE